MSKIKKATVASKVIAYVLIILVVVGVIDFIFVFTDGFNSNFKTFYVEHEGQRILNNENGLVLDGGKEHRFDIKRPLGFNGNKVDYTVSIYANDDENNSFDFSIDGDVYAFFAEGDITSGFDIVLNDTCFTITIPENATVKDVLTKLYPYSNVDVPDEGTKITHPFLLIVSLNDNSVKYSIPFGFHYGVTGVKLQTEVIIF